MVIIRELLKFLEEEKITFEFKGDINDVVDGFLLFLDIEPEHLLGVKN